MPPTPSTAKKGPSLRLLIAKLNDVQFSFDDIWRFVEEFTEEETGTAITIRLERLDEIW